MIRAATAGVRLLPPAMRLHFRPLGVGQHISVHRQLSRLRKKSPFACFEGGLIAAVKADLAGERAVWGAFGGARAEGGIHLVIALPGEAYPVRAVATVEIAADRTEDELAASLRLEGDVSGLEHVYEIGVPQLHLGDPPPSEQWVLARGHQVVSSLGRRIRL